MLRLPPGHAPGGQAEEACGGRQTRPGEPRPPVVDPAARRSVPTGTDPGWPVPAENGHGDTGYRHRDQEAGDQRQRRAAATGGAGRPVPSAWRRLTDSYPRADACPAGRQRHVPRGGALRRAGGGQEQAFPARRLRRGLSAGDSPPWSRSAGLHLGRGHPVKGGGAVETTGSSSAAVVPVPNGPRRGGEGQHRPRRGPWRLLPYRPQCGVQQPKRPDKDLSHYQAGSGRR